VRESFVVLEDVTRRSVRSVQNPKPPGRYCLVAEYAEHGDLAA
jgi:hypothetical protein